MALIQVRSSTRSTPRHHIDIPCEVIGRGDPVLMWATDMSSDGLWLETGDRFEKGEHLVVCFKPGVRWRARELMVFGEVARMSAGMRVEDDGPGIGLAFMDLTGPERWCLRSWLRPRPEKLASSRRGMRTHAQPALDDRILPLSPFARRVD